MVKPKTAYAVLAHKRPDLLHRLVETLGSSPIAIHVDAKSDMDLAEIMSTPNVTMLPRRRCHWGGYQLVAATLDALRWFMTTDASHLILLSGQCYPLVSQTQAVAHLTALGARSQMRMAPFPISRWGPAGGYERVQRYYFFAFRSRPWRLKWLPRKMPRDLHPHGGSQFWCLSQEHAAYILSYVSDRPDVVRFYSTSLIPDEMMLQTILANSPYAAEVVCDVPLTYASFVEGGASPQVLKLEDMEQAWASGSIVARKFEDHEVLDTIDLRVNLSV